MNLNERQRKLLKRTFLDYQQTAEFFKNPLIVQRAEGLYYWDVEGKRYFDGIGGIFVAHAWTQTPAPYGQRCSGRWKRGVLCLRCTGLRISRWILSRSWAKLPQVI